VHQRRGSGRSWNGTAAHGHQGEEVRAGDGGEHLVMRAIDAGPVRSAGPSARADRPVPPPPEIGISDVAAAGARSRPGPGTWHLMTGQPYLMRPVGRPPRTAEPVPGLDLAALSSCRVSDQVLSSDEVFGFGRATFADYAARTKTISPQAGRAPSTGRGGCPVVRGHRPVGPSPTSAIHRWTEFLVTGASGGVRHYAVQLAMHTG